MTRLNSDENDQIWTIGRILQWTTERLTDCSESPRLDAEVLLAHCLGVTRVNLYMDFHKPLNSPERDRFRTAVRRRIARESVAHIIGQREFWSLTFSVDRNVLIPRPETELLVEQAVQWLRTRPSPQRVIDVGTGSGAIAVAIATEVPQANITATDVSLPAIHVALRNARRHNAHINFVVSNLLGAIAPRQLFDLIAANLPYIPSIEIDQLSPEVKDNDPHLALDGGADGLDLIRELIVQATNCMNHGGKIMLELDPRQAETVSALLSQSGFSDARSHADLAGHLRIVSATYV